MKIRWHRFNIYLLTALALVLVCSCRTAEGKRKKALATLQLRQEITRDSTGRGETVTVHKDPLITMTVDPTPFLTDANVKKAKVVEVPGGYALSIQFDRQGAWLLEQFTASSLGRHIAIFSQFGEPPDYKLNKGHWIAAPKISSHITDGLLIFTPDTTREEAETIATGLSNVAKKLGNDESDSKW
jgi:preprotein translocase subunit SecD